jgi:3-hydroxymyristoyl/3-hydroxydecanoyl-(acyl carrier protein) dehydratase
MTHLSTLELPSHRLIDLNMTFLPIGQMRQITQVTEVLGSSITGEAELGAEHWVWPQHFPSDPIFPGTLIIEAAGQLVAIWAWAQGVRGRPRLVRTNAEFQNPVSRSSRRLILEGEVRRKLHAYFGTVHVSSEEVPVAVIEAVLVVLPETDGIA